MRQCGPTSLVLGDYRLERAIAQAREYPEPSGVRREGLGLQLGRIVNALKELGPAGPEPIAIVAVAHGRRAGRQALAQVSMLGPSDYGVTAMSAVAFARLLESRRGEVAGASHPLRHFRLNDVIETINHPDLKMLESESKTIEPI